MARLPSDIDVGIDKLIDDYADSFWESVDERSLDDLADEDWLNLLEGDEDGE